MSLAQISPTSVIASPSNINPLANVTQHFPVAQSNQAADQSIKETKTDTITISGAAVQMSDKLSKSNDEPEVKRDGSR